MGLKNLRGRIVTDGEHHATLWRVVSDWHDTPGRQVRFLYVAPSLNFGQQVVQKDVKVVDSECMFVYNAYIKKCSNAASSNKRSLTDFILRYIKQVELRDSDTCDDTLRQLE